MLPVKVSILSGRDEVARLAVRLDELATERWGPEQGRIFVASTGTPSRHGKLTSLSIMLEYRSIYILTNPTNIALLAPFLQHPRLTKILFDSRDLADYLFRCHQITLTRVLDLQIVEVAKRGSLPTRTPLPVRAVQTKGGAITRVVLRDHVFNTRQCTRHYLSDHKLVADQQSLEHFYRGYFGFLSEFRRLLLPGEEEGTTATPNSNTVTPPSTTTATLDLLLTISNRYSKLNSGKTSRSGDQYDTHSRVYPYILQPGQVLGVVECRLCHVVQPLESFNTHNLYSSDSEDRVCRVCQAILEKDRAKQCYTNSKSTALKLSCLT